jgi:Plasmid encoded RepA protein
MNRKNIDKLISQALAIEEEEAKEAGTLGYVARVLVQATMPHSNPQTLVFERTNGNLSLAILGHPKVGLPYGTYPRLLLSWLVTEAVRKKSPELVLGSSLSKFMSELDLIPSGGRWGTISRLRDQMRRLFSASVSCVYEKETLSGGIGFNIAKEYHLWWDPKNPAQTDFWQSTVILGLDFFNEIVARPVPIDMRAMKALKTSSMALDLYCWLTYRLSYLKRQTEIPWPLLQNQFGSDYADTKQGRYEFKRKLFTQLRKVAVVYEGATGVREGEYGLVLVPGASHIKKLCSTY